eukprot:8299067-Pyramimonas_sp.AAC.1
MPGGNMRMFRQTVHPEHHLEKARAVRHPILDAQAGLYPHPNLHAVVATWVSARNATIEKKAFKM